MSKTSSSIETNKLPEKELLTPQEVARHYRVSVPTIYRWINDGRLPGHRIARTIRIQRRDIPLFKPSTSG